MKTDNAKRFLRVAPLLAVAVTWANLAQAQSCNVSWTGNAGDALWSTAGNWSTNQVPGPTSDVCILTAPSDQGSCAPVGCIYATGVPSISIHSLQVGGGAGLFFGSGTVSIATSLTVQASQTSPKRILRRSVLWDQPELPHSRCPIWGVAAGIRNHRGFAHEQLLHSGGFEPDGDGQLHADEWR